MAVQADTATADERAELARAVETQIEGHPEWILLSTCHRVELYGFGARPDLDAPLQVQTGEKAVRHLIRVAAGLESAIVGEDEVLHQVREALGQARLARRGSPSAAMVRNSDCRRPPCARRADRLQRQPGAQGGGLASGEVDFGGRSVLVVGAGRWDLLSLTPSGWPEARSRSRAGTRRGRSDWPRFTAAKGWTSRTARSWPRTALPSRLRSPAFGTSCSHKQVICRRSRISRRRPPFLRPSGPAPMATFSASTICTSAYRAFRAATSMRQTES